MIQPCALTLAVGEAPRSFLTYFREAARLLNGWLINIFERESLPALS
jgi:hypothetical protein